MRFRYINYQDQLENAYCGGYALAAMINLFDSSLAENKPYGKDIYREIQKLQNMTLNNNRKYFIDSMNIYLYDHNVEGSYSLPSSMALYAQKIGLNPIVYYNKLKLKESLYSVINDIKLNDFNIGDLIEEEISLITSSNIQVVENVTDFLIMNSLSLVDNAMHWIALGDIKVKIENDKYYDPEAKGKLPYEYSGINIVLNPIK